jgi:hypothetical protein
VSKKEEPRRRRVVKRSTRIPPLSELYAEAAKRGLTVKEYMDVMAQLNGRKSRRAK